MITIRSLLPVLVAVSLTGVSAAAQKKGPPEPKSEPMSEATALAILGSDAGLHEKARACQELGVYGGPKSVSALAALLDQEHLADYARSGLEGIKDPAAGAALRKALAKLNGRFLAGAVNSLGVRREIAAVADLRKLALDPKRGVASEALASLGLIGTKDAAETLTKVLTGGPANLRIDAAHASLTAAAQLAKDNNRAAARGLLDAVVRALPPGHLRTVAESQAAALGATPARAAAR